MSVPTAGEISVFSAIVEDFRNWSSSRVTEARAAKDAGAANVDPNDIAAMDIIGRMLADKLEEIVKAGSSPTMVLATFAQMLGMLIGRWGITQTAETFPLQMTSVVMHAIQLGVDLQRDREHISTKKH